MSAFTHKATDTYAALAVTCAVKEPAMHLPLVPEPSGVRLA